MFGGAVLLCVYRLSAQRRSPVAHSIKLNARGPNCTSACDSILASPLERTTQLITRSLHASISHLRLCALLQDGWTAAHQASIYGEPDCLKMLIDAKCNPNATTVSWECIRREFGCGQVYKILCFCVCAYMLFLLLFYLFCFFVAFCFFFYLFYVYIDITIFLYIYI